eukprot:tig00001335_g8208.t1
MTDKENLPVLAARGLGAGAFAEPEKNALASAPPAAAEAGPVLQLSAFSKPAMLDFGEVRRGQRKFLELQLQNDGLVSAEVLVEKFPYAKGFSVDRDEASVPPLSTMPLSVSWAPAAAGGVRETALLKLGGRHRLQVVFLGAKKPPAGSAAKPPAPAAAAKPPVAGAAKKVLKQSILNAFCGTPTPRQAPAPSPAPRKPAEREPLKPRAPPTRDSAPRIPPLALPAPPKAAGPATPRQAPLASPRLAAGTSAPTTPRGGPATPRGGPATPRGGPATPRGAGAGSATAVRRQGPYRDVFDDESGPEKQERAFTEWINFLLCPPAPATAGGAEAGNAGQAALRDYSTRLAEARLRQRAHALYKGDELAPVLANVDRLVESGQIAVRGDTDWRSDVGVREGLLSLLFSYAPRWLRLGLEVVHGLVIPVPAGADPLAPLARFLEEGPLAPATPGPDAVRRLLRTVLLLDRAKRAGLLEECLFCKEAPVKSSTEMLRALGRAVLRGEGDLARHLRRWGAAAEHEQAPLDEFDWRVAGPSGLAGALRDGVRLARLVQALSPAADLGLLARLRTPAEERSRRLHNVALAVQAAGRTLALLWALFRSRCLPSLADVARLRSEAAAARERAWAAAAEAPEGEAAAAQEECSVLGIDGGAEGEGEGPEAVQAALFEWARAVAALHGVRVRNWTTSLGSGRALCAIAHHYLPAALPLACVKGAPRPGDEEADEGSDEEGLAEGRWMQSYSPGRGGLSERARAALEAERHNARLVLSLARSIGGVPPLVRAEDLVRPAVPDERCVVMFVAYLARRLLDLSTECSAALAIQRLWKRRRPRGPPPTPEAARELRRRRAATRIQRAWRDVLERAARREAERRAAAARAAALAAARTAATARIRAWALRRAQRAALLRSVKAASLEWRGLQASKAPLTPNPDPGLLAGLRRPARLRPRSRRRVVDSALLEVDTDAPRNPEPAFKTRARGGDGDRGELAGLRGPPVVRQARAAATAIAASWRGFVARRSFGQARAAATAIAASWRASWPPVVRPGARGGDGDRGELAGLRGPPVVRPGARGGDGDRGELAGLRGPPVVRPGARGGDGDRGELAGLRGRRSFGQARAAATAIAASWRASWPAGRSARRARRDGDRGELAGFVARRSFGQARAAATAIAASWRGFVARRSFGQARAAATAIAASWRGFVARRSFGQARAAATAIAASWRGSWPAGRSPGARAATAIAASWRASWPAVVRPGARGGDGDRGELAGLRGPRSFGQARAAATASCGLCRVVRRRARRASRSWRARAAVVRPGARAATAIAASWRASWPAVVRQARAAATAIAASWRGFVPAGRSARRAAATAIAASWRGFVARRSFGQARAAATAIAASWRGFVARRSFGQARAAATAIAASWRGFVARRRARDCDRGELAGFVAAVVRPGARGGDGDRGELAGLRARRSFGQARAAATAIAASWRGFVAAVVRPGARAATAIAASWRGFVARRRARGDGDRGELAGFVARRSFGQAARGDGDRGELAGFVAAVVRPGARGGDGDRGELAGFVARRSFGQARAAATAIAASWRGFVARRARGGDGDRGELAGFVARRSFGQARAAATAIAASWRGFVARRSFRQARAAATAIAASWRGFVARRSFGQARAAATAIAASWRGFARAAATAIAASWRGFVARRAFAAELVRGFNVRQAAATLLQSLVRGLLQRKFFQHIRANIREYRAALLLQRCVRVWLSRRRVERCGSAAVVIQRWFRVRLDRLRFLRLRSAVCALQPLARARVARRKAAAGVLTAFARSGLAGLCARRRIQAILCIQSHWRGHKIRRAGAQKLRQLRERLAIATREATEAGRIGNRTAAALEALFRSSRLAVVMDACKALEISTRYSPRCCERLAESGATAIIFGLIRSCNRSLPHLELVGYALGALANIARRPATAGALLQTEDAPDILAEHVAMYRDRANIFEGAVAVLSALAAGPEQRAAVAARPEAVRKLQQSLQLLEHKAALDRKAAIAKPAPAPPPPAAAARPPLRAKNAGALVLARAPAGKPGAGKGEVAAVQHAEGAAMLSALLARLCLVPQAAAGPGPSAHLASPAFGGSSRRESLLGSPAPSRRSSSTRPAAPAAPSSAAPRSSTRKLV